jgi:CRISPR-associated protein Cas1
MAVLYVSQPGAEIRKQGGRLCVKWHGQVLTSLPLRSVGRIVCLGPVQLTAAATRRLLQARIPVLFCSGRGRYYGTMSVGSEDVELLLLQLARYQDPTFRIGVAQALVGAKIRHQQRFLRRQARNHPHPSLTQTADRLGQLLATLPHRSSVAEVMGVEGQASALYFSALAHCLRQEGITFPGRTRHPPKDPVNAILSLGYMLVLGEVLSAILAQGLHAGIGFLHEVHRRRPALALDLLELARQPIVDRLTLSLFNRGVLTPADFHPHPDGGVRLQERSLKRYLHFYERALTTPFRWGPQGRVGTFRDWLRGEVEGLKEAIQEGGPWQPTVLEL